jgi:hypothetical protein
MLVHLRNASSRAPANEVATFMLLNLGKGQAAVTRHNCLARGAENRGDPATSS